MVGKPGMPPLFRSEAGILVQQAACLIGTFQITWILIINACFKVRNLIADKGGKQLYQLVRFSAGFGKVFNHDAVQLPDVLEAGDRIFTSCDRIEAAIWDPVLFNEFVPNLLKGEAMVYFRIIQLLFDPLFSQCLNNDAALIFGLAGHIFDQGTYIKIIILLFLCHKRFHSCQRKGNPMPIMCGN